METKLESARYLRDYYINQAHHCWVFPDLTDCYTLYDYNMTMAAKYDRMIDELMEGLV